MGTGRWSYSAASHASHAHSPLHTAFLPMKQFNQLGAQIHKGVESYISYVYVCIHSSASDKTCCSCHTLKGSRARQHGRQLARSLRPAEGFCISFPPTQPPLTNMHCHCQRTTTFTQPCSCPHSPPLAAIDRVSARRPACPWSPHAAARSLPALRPPQAQPAVPTGLPAPEA